MATEAWLARLLLVLEADDVFGASICRAARCSSTRRASGERRDAVLAHAMQQLHDERRSCERRERRRGPRRSPLEARDVGVGGAARAACRHDFVGQAAQVFDQRQLQHARPRPQLADRERRDALIAVEELRQLLPVEPAVAVAQQLDRDRVDARVAGLLARRQRRQLAVVAPRQVLADVDDLRRDQVEVVEEPFSLRG